MQLYITMVSILKMIHKVLKFWNLRHRGVNKPGSTRTRPGLPTLPPTCGTLGPIQPPAGLPLGWAGLEVKSPILPPALHCLSCAPLTCPPFSFEDISTVEKIRPDCRSAVLRRRGAGRF